MVELGFLLVAQEKKFLLFLCIAPVLSYGSFGCIAIRRGIGTKILANPALGAFRTNRLL